VLQNIYSDYVATLKERVLLARRKLSTGKWGQGLLRQAKPGKGGRDDVAAVTRKLFVVNLAGTQACPAKGGRPPEARLAWWWGDPSCEA